MTRREFLRNVLGLGLGLALAPYAVTEAAWQTGTELAGVDVVPTNLDFRSLERRRVTDAIIVHHIGGTNADVSAATVHQWHLANGWSGIGYHYVIRKDGTIEQGRPLYAVGAHCYGENWHTVGVNIVGNFEVAQPNEAQLNSAARLLAALCMNYGFAPTAHTIFGHRDFNATACPGANMYARLPELIERTAAAYGLPDAGAVRRQPTEEPASGSADAQTDVSGVQPDDGFAGTDTPLSTGRVPRRSDAAGKQPDRGDRPQHRHLER